MNKLFGFTLISILLSGLFSCSSNERKLPIYGERTPVEKEVDGKKIVDTLYQTIPNFSFLNQDSAQLTQDFFKGKIYVANFFFTHCPSICPTMQRNLLKAYKKYKGNEKIAFLSHSIDFKYDQPYILKDYANKLGVDNDQWQFVNGTKADIYGMADKYLVYAKEDASVPGGYDHQGYLVIIDPEKRIRGAYDGTDETQVNKLLEDLDVILNEYK
ncbi:SCO family protein [Sphingobacterium sp. DK4209]|uniref:SCO family protein n=1 Tax=Sphingobacterium zhuxiongii TaxID=2662364 RepID=A0A5Q0QHG1_9SPHI|nr:MULTISPECIES: SCO family protein [unclassified Sphingobacterium]MVZ67492.1 SCO family protein [Sphingobacterium sp. DK4209]QGA27222.1 SCO family protein [Sphingobacterium sp. dk4302]